MSKTLRVSRELALPLDYVTSTDAVVAKKGSGKTYYAMVLAEELLAHDQQIVVLDPTGAWWGLRSKADGKTAGFSIAVFGGDHGDLALEPTAGVVIAEAIASEAPAPAMPAAVNRTRKLAASPIPQETTNGQRSASSATDRVAALPPGEIAVLTAVIQFRAGLLRAQLSIITGYKRATRNAYVARLRQRGLVEVEGERVMATDRGVAALPSAKPLPVGAALREHWMRQLPDGERRVLEIVCGIYPETIARSSIDESTGFQRSTRNAYIQRLRAKELLIEVGREEIKASDSLFLEGAN